MAIGDKALKKLTLMLGFICSLFVVVAYYFYTSNETLKNQSQKNLKSYENLAMQYKSLQNGLQQRTTVHAYIQNNLTNDVNLALGTLLTEQTQNTIILTYEANDIRLLHIFVNKILNQPFVINSFKMTPNKITLEIAL